LQECWRSAQCWLTSISANNQIEEAGAESFAEVLAQCTALAHLSLGNNQIGDAGTDSLAGVLVHCRAGSPGSQLE
jgi:Ran GTPase-activating protein (RanGAP) involved in mRNA processing and transport